MANEAPTNLPPHGVELPEVSQGVRGAVPEARVSVLSPFNAIRARAREMYCLNGNGCEVKIEPGATVFTNSERGGHWVKAWVWVPPEG